MHFADRLIESIKKKKSVACVGLDPQLSKLPGFLVTKMKEQYGPTLKAAANAYLEFNKGIIDAVKDLAPAVKPQLAFYEELGYEGILVFEKTCQYAKAAGLLVIADGKRNDIGSSAEAYARGFLGKVELFEQKKSIQEVDALTVNAYLGLDSVRPFIKVCNEEEKGIFILVKTSNPSSGDLQNRVTADENISIAELMGHFVESWGSDSIGASGYSSVGAVVGATYSDVAAKLRKIMPQSIFLVPGYGTQGASAKDVRPCFNEDGFGALVVNARGIIYAFGKNEGSGEHYQEAARVAVLKMNEELSV